MSVDTLLISVISGVVTGVGVLADVNTNVLAGVIAAVNFVISERLKEFSCWAAFDCWTLALLD